MPAPGERLRVVSQRQRRRRGPRGRPARRRWPVHRIRGIHDGTGSSQPRSPATTPNGEQRRHLRPLPQVEVERAVGRERPGQTHDERPDDDAAPATARWLRRSVAVDVRMVGRGAKRRRRRRTRAARRGTTVGPVSSVPQSSMNIEPRSAASWFALGPCPDHARQRADEERVDDERDSQARSRPRRNGPDPCGPATVERAARRAGTGRPSRTGRQEGSPPPRPPRWQRSRSAPRSTSRYRARRRWRRGGR